ncbi:hypothetical protein VSX61_05260 [Brenneria populi subsp. brevivirga]|uniref:hypothetical protein n=1 Tax=Brenneria populi TaxID=1505588 RepID=UPI002E180C45|nr:hypothetical protein [Brenneria populi subsp. brevivirga]
MSDEGLAEISARVNAREFRKRIAVVRVMTGAEIKEMRARYGFLNTLAAKGPDVFAN